MRMLYLRLFLFFSDVSVSQGNVVTHLKYGGIYSMNLQLCLWWKNFENQSAFGKVIGKNIVAPFPDTVQYLCPNWQNKKPRNCIFSCKLESTCALIQYWLQNIELSILIQYTSVTWQKTDEWPLTTAYAMLHIYALKKKLDHLKIMSCEH